jgi:hypothetical protein
MATMNNSANKNILLRFLTGLLVLLFSYTATSKFLDQELFVFQMRLAPLPLMIAAAPILGWLVPSIEMLIAIGLLINSFRLKALYASVILLVLFEFYIIGMLLSGHQLPCTCGGIISTMNWKQHLLFNALFIFIGLTTIIKIKINNVSSKNGEENIKGLSCV